MQDQAEGLGASIVSRLAGAWMVDSEWSSPIDGGFRWWAHRLEQRITVEERPVTVEDSDVTEAVMRAETTVLTNVPDEEAAVIRLAEVNQRSGAFALCYEPAQHRVVAVSTATMIGWYEPLYHLFSHAATLQICQAEKWADVLAAELGAETAASAHPEGGARPEPDEMLNWIGYSWSRPEWVIGSYELIPLVEPLAEMLETGLDLARGEGADELDVWPAGYSFPLHNPWNEQNPFRATVASAIWHPDLGPGARLQITAPFDLGQSAAEFANLLNSAPTRPQAGLIGAWWTSSGQLGFTGFLPQLLLGPLLAREEFRDEQPGIIDTFVRLTVLGQKISFCAVLEESGISFGDAEPPATATGYSEFLDRLLLGAKRAIVAGAAESTPEWSPEEYRAGELVSGRVLRTVDPDVRLAVFGTFNPVGPTLNTIGVLELADGRYLLANWMRHPFSPDYSPALVLPDLDPATVRDALVEVLPFCAVGTAATDFVGVHAPETLQDAVSSAFMTAAADRGQLGEIWAKAQVLEKSRGNPWASLHSGTPGAAPLPGNPAEVVSRWWNAVTNDQNYYGYLRSFPEAWDGAISFLKGEYFEPGAGRGR
jgi:hypothetical protein